MEKFVFPVNEKKKKIIKKVCIVSLIYTKRRGVKDDYATHQEGESTFLCVCVCVECLPKTKENKSIAITKRQNDQTKKKRKRFLKT